jgi:alkylated DNA repair protein (DNA oxidative demethylase)
VPRALTEEPRGLVYRPRLLSVAEERELVTELGSLGWDPIVLHGAAARRSGRHFGLDYDYQRRTPQPGEPIPDAAVMDLGE